MDSTTSSSMYFALSTAGIFLLAGLILSFKRGRAHPLLLISLSAMSYSWIEAPYDWAMYAQFPPALPRMPEWWPLNMTWGGLPQSVPLGYVSYFGIPALASVWLALWLSRSFKVNRPIALLVTGLIVGFFYALYFNGYIGAKLGVFRYGRVIEGLAIREGTLQQYPLYDALAMGIQVMVVAYLLGRTDALGRTIIDAWADSKTKSRFKSSLISIVCFMIIGNAVYLSVFAPHLVTKVMHLVAVAPPGQIYEGVENQPL